MADEEKNVYRRRSIRKASQSSYIVIRNAKIELREKLRKVTEVLKKPDQERTAQDKVLVKKNPELVKASQKNARKLQSKKERILEVEDEPTLLLQKCEKLADLIKSSKNVVVYTGAGISTAASIPDYRGPNGVWTLLKRGQMLSPQDLSDAEPTFTHMSLTKLFRVGKVKHIVSQNCDGLHIRSGFPRHAISEVHGNMYIECCYSCAPYKEFVRLFDVTERTGVHRHTTSRHCRSCGGSLQDTIVHFGEKGKLKSPYRWKEAVRAANRADLILCLGSSLKVLRKYSCLWCMDKKPQNRPKLVIINLQWTPKDDVATLKINGKCDTVMMKVMTLLDYEVPEYKREQDPIFKLCTPLRASEIKTTAKKILIPPTHQALKYGNRSRKKVVSKSTAPKRSSRLTSSAKKNTDFLCQVHLLSKSLFPLEPAKLNCNSELYAEQLMKEHINFDREPKDEFTWSSEVYYPVMVNLLQLPDTSTVSENNALNNCHIDSTENLSDFRLHYIQNNDFKDSAVSSELFTYIVPKARLKCRRQPKHLSQEEAVQNSDQMLTSSCKVQQEQLEKCCSSSCLSEHLDSHIENNSLYEQEDDSGYQSKNIPELVVVDLGKDDYICEWKQQKLDDIYTFSNENVLGTETVLCLSSWEVDSILTDLLVTDPKLILSQQIKNVSTNTSPSGNVNNLSHTMGLSGDHSSSDIIHSNNVSAFQASDISEQQHLGTKEEAVNMLPFCGEPVVHRCSGTSCSREYEDCHAGQKIMFKTVLEKIKDISLDHCYSLPVTSAQNQPFEEPLTVNHQNAETDNNTKCSLSWFPLADQISHSVGSCCTSKQVHSGSCHNISHSFIQENKSVCSSSSLEVKSSHIHPSSGSLSNSVISHNACAQIVLEENTCNPSSTLVNQRQENSIYAFTAIPSCILNMDDMEIVCSQTGNQSELSPDSSDHYAHNYTNVVETSKVLIPWNTEVWVLPAEGTQFHSCADNELQTFEANLLSDSCHLELKVDQSVNGTIYENSANCCNENHVNCFLSDTVHLHGLYAESKAPANVSFEPNVHSLFDIKKHSCDTFKNRNSHVASFPEVTSLQINDKVCKYNLKDSFLSLQGNMEVEKVNIKRCHQISQMPYCKTSSNHGCNKEERENVRRQVFKRKEALAAVPGWFGKGLIVRKKKKW